MRSRVKIPVDGQDEEEEKDSLFPETISLALLLKHSSLDDSGLVSIRDMASFHRLWINRLPREVCLTCKELDIEDEYTDDESFPIQVEDKALVVQVEVVSMGRLQYTCSFSSMALDFFNSFFRRSTVSRVRSKVPRPSNLRLSFSSWRSR